MHDDESPRDADPTIRKDYEAELGCFLLSHNEVDYRLAKVVGRCFAAMGGDQALIGKSLDGSFDSRLNLFALLQSFRAELEGVDVPRLREINADRNKLAHGHMDQNPFDGSYKILERRTFLQKKAFPVESVQSGRRHLEKVADRLFAMECWYDFDDLDPLDT